VKTAAARGDVALVLHQARFDLRGFIRNRQARFFTLALPLIFLVIFTGIFGNHVVGPGNTKLSAYYVPGISAMAVIAASFINLVISITVLREEGILKRRRATPVPAWVLIGGRTLMSLTVATASVVLLLLVGRFGFHVHMPPRAIPGFALTAVVGVITFCVLGYAFSTAISNEDAAQPMVQAVMLPLYFISGIFIVPTQLPSWLRNIAKVFPVQHLAHGLQHAFIAPAGIGIDWSDLGVMAIWAAIGVAVALRRFSWLPKAATG
jgi:ABC-2 type transport system permease protein